MADKKLRARIFNITQYETNPKTGEDLHFNEKNIINCVKHKGIKYAYILHDKDVYTKDDKEKDGHNTGDLKGRHWHLVMQCADAKEVETIAKWLGIPQQYIEIPKGRGAFLDCVQYLTHESEKEKAKGKHVYESSEVTANFDFRAELEKREEIRIKYGRDLTPEQKMLYDVLYNGKTIREVIAEDDIFYMQNYKKVDSARLKYIQGCNPPTTRINFYIEGRGRVGKGLLSRAIARSLYPNLQNDDDIFFSVGDEKTTFEGYDGQPVIIWNDCRSFELFNMLGSRGNIFKVFDTHPEKERQNIKYGSVNLINAVNIVNSVQHFTEFLNGLSGEYTSGGVQFKSEDKGQAYGRFPIIIPIHEDDISILINKGFIENSKEFLEYIEYMNIIGNFQKIAIACGNNLPLQRRIESKTVQPIADKYKEILDNIYEEKTEDEIWEMFKNYGQDTGLRMPFM